MVKHTDKETLLLHVHHYTDPKATIYTDEWRAYEQVVRKHQTVSSMASRSGQAMTTEMGSGKSTSTLSKDCGRACATS